MSKLTPNPDRLLVIPVDGQVQDKSKGGILLVTPETSQPMVKIVAVGDNVNGYTAGDRCLLASYGGQPFEWESINYFIISPSEILVKVK